MPLGEDDLSVIQTELVDLRALIHKGVFLSRQTYVLIEIKKNIGFNLKSKASAFGQLKIKEMNKSLIKNACYI